ncbi:MAG: stage 0 sporulation protein [Christensenellaceae bacterium]|jgi:cell fate regulator YaaT (PSP1 superfamily)|nr:stage 0 sporulation protein [Christensenellaceae bacterium]
MPFIIGVKFKTGLRTYFFDPGEEQFKKNEKVIVETARGVEFGEVSFGNTEVCQNKIPQELKPIIRRANEEDCKKHDYNISARPILFEKAMALATKHNLSMKIVEIEYNFDRTKLMVYFTSPNNTRVDFRVFTKEFAAMNKVKVEMRQIYDRDDIKFRGNLGICGRTCCCITHLQDYDKVSVKMAKLQNLPITPAKLAGCCGKMMCCIAYENETYKKNLKNMPQLNTYAKTDEYEGHVIGYNLIAEEVKIKVNREDKAYQVCKCPLSKLQCCGPRNNENKEIDIDKEIIEMPDEAFE